jgi:hypothetical protein
MFFKNKEKKPTEVAVLVVSRKANIQIMEVKNAFGNDVIVIMTDDEVRNGIEYLGSQTRE